MSNQGTDCTVAGPDPGSRCVGKEIAVRTKMLGLLGVLCLLGAPLLAEDVPRMTKEELRPLLGQESVVVIDTRMPGDWGASQGKIPGAVRRPPDEVAAWAGEFPKEATIVVYCA